MTADPRSGTKAGTKTGAGPAAKPGSKAARREKNRLRQEEEQRRKQRAAGHRRLRVTALVAAAAVAVTTGLYFIFRQAEESPAAGYDIGKPGIGATAPDFSLPSSAGGTESLADYRGENVLLYFQEGLGCQPCWDQLTDLEKTEDLVKAAGVDKILSLTVDPADLVARKVKDDGITTPVLADPDLKVSKTYTTNQYGMMGTSENGHSFILVGPDGKIDWRADYGGAPDYTMHVPVDKLLKDLKAGQQA